MIGKIFNMPEDMTNKKLWGLISAEGVILAVGFAFTLGVAWTTLADDVAETARRQESTELSIAETKESVAELSDQMIEFSVEQRFIREDIEEIKEQSQAILEALTSD